LNAITPSWKKTRRN